MLTSLKVVRMAAVDCDCTSRSAMRWRSRDIGTRCSVRSPVGIWMGSGGALDDWAPACAGATAAALAVGFARPGGAGISPVRVPMTSPFVTRPSRPVPAIVAVSMPFSAAIFFADGDGDWVPACAGDWTPACAGVAAAALGATFASVSIIAITSPLVTLSPSFFTILASTPSAGAGSSSTTLSVSTSIRFSSRLTASPAFFFQLTSVASETDSESCGTLTSTCIWIPYRATRVRAQFREADRMMPTSVRMNWGLTLGRLLLGHFRAQRRLDEFLLLLHVQLHVADRRRRRRGASRILEVLVGTHVAREVVLDAVPRALVAGLLLAPHDALRARIGVDLRLELVVREGIELLEAHDRDVLDAALGALGDDVVVHLARAEDHTPHFLRRELLDLGDDHLEAAAREFRELRGRFLLAQQALRRHHDEGLAHRAQDLAPDHVEELRRRRGHANLDVVLGAELQVALEPRGRVLRPLAFVAVRQEHRERAQPSPLRLARGDELVDHHLRAVGEVAELRFPDDELEGLRGRVAVFEAEHGLFGEERIDDDEIALAVADVLQRDVDARIPLLAVLVVQHRVAMRERAAAAVLSREAHGMTLVDDPGVSEVL